MKKAIVISILTALSGVAIAAAQPTDKPAHEGGCGKGRVHHFEKLDKNADGKVTRDEMLSGITAHFDQADTNKDGTLSDAEQKAAHEKRSAERFSKEDKNGDGVLTQDELPAHFGERLMKLDANKDGKLTREELSKLGEMHAQWKGRFHGDKADQPHTRANLVAHVDQRFAKLDTNKDGALTPDEMAKGHHFRGHHGPREQQ
jgi:Ca2+-binding EF-hand superfamily protein